MSGRLLIQFGISGNLIYVVNRIVAVDGRFGRATCICNCICLGLSYRCCTPSASLLEQCTVRLKNDEKFINFNLPMAHTNNRDGWRSQGARIVAFLVRLCSSLEREFKRIWQRWTGKEIDAHRKSIKRVLVVAPAVNGICGRIRSRRVCFKVCSGSKSTRSLTSPHRAYRTQFRISLDLSLSPRFRLQRLHGELRK